MRSAICATHVLTWSISAAILWIMPKNMPSTAIGEIKQAAIMDGKNIADHMPVDAHLARHDRFRKAMELLDQAKRDVSGEEDQPDTQGLQLRVIHHIDEAKRSVRHAIEMLN